MGEHTSEAPRESWRERPRTSMLEGGLHRLILTMLMVIFGLYAYAFRAFIGLDDPPFLSSIGAFLAGLSTTVLLALYLKRPVRR